MTRSDLLRTVAIQTGVSLRSCERVYDAVFGEMMDALIQGEKVRVDGFFTFEPVELMPRKIKSLKTGRVELTKPSRKVKCKFSRQFKDSVKEKAREEYEDDYVQEYE